MIENDKQLEVTRQRLAEFEDAIKRLESLPPPANKHEELDRKLNIGSLSSFIREFKEDIANYLQSQAL